MNDGLDALRDTKTILLTTYRRDGTGVATPVSIAFEGDRAFFRTWDTAGKYKRLRRSPRVEVAPSTLRGGQTGPALPAEARALEGEQAGLARRALVRRHPVLHRLLVPLGHRLMRVRTVHYELHPRALAPHRPHPIRLRRAVDQRQGALDQGPGRVVLE